MIQFAALTLSNISTSTGAKHYLKPYESDLMMIGFTDDSLAGIIANILSDIAAPWSYIDSSTNTYHNNASIIEDSRLPAT